MLKRFFSAEPRIQMPLNMIGDEYAGLSPADDPADSEKPSFICMFEPIYRREESGFVPAGHKVVSQLSASTEPDTFQVFHDHKPANALARAMECGVSQLEIISAQIDHFMRFKQHQMHQKLVFEIDMSDFEIYKTQHMQLREIVAGAAQRGLGPEDFVIELPASHHLDPGDLYCIARDLRDLGVMIALTELDSDAFSFKRIFQVSPNVIKLNGSWFEQALDDPLYISMTRNIVAGFSAKGLHVAMTDVATEQHARFAHECGAIRVQGPFFGKPAEEIARGRSILL